MNRLLATAKKTIEHLIETPSRTSLLVGSTIHSIMWLSECARGDTYLSDRVRDLGETPVIGALQIAIPYAVPFILMSYVKAKQKGEKMFGGWKNAVYSFVKSPINVGVSAALILGLGYGELRETNPYKENYYFKYGKAENGFYLVTRHDIKTNKQLDNMRIVTDDPWQRDWEVEKWRHVANIQNRKYPKSCSRSF